MIRTLAWKEYRSPLAPRGAVLYLYPKEPVQNPTGRS